MLPSCCIPSFPQGKGESDGRNNNGKGEKMGIMQESEAPTWAGAVWPEAELLVGSAQGLPELLTAFFVCREKLRDTALHSHLLREWPGKARQERKPPGWQSSLGCFPRISQDAA